MVYDVWIALAIVVLTCARWLFFKGPFLWFIALVDFTSILISYYSSLHGFEYYFNFLTINALIGVLILVCAFKDSHHVNLYLNFAILIFVTAFLDLLKAFGIIETIYYLYLGRFSTMIELILINSGFWYVRGSGFLNGYTSNTGFFHTWSCHSPYFKTVENQKIRKLNNQRTIQ